MYGGGCTTTTTSRTAGDAGSCRMRLTAVEWRIYGVESIGRDGMYKRISRSKCVQTESNEQELQKLMCTLKLDTSCKPPESCWIHIQKWIDVCRIWCMMYNTHPHVWVCVWVCVCLLLCAMWNFCSSYKSQTQLPLFCSRRRHRHRQHHHHHHQSPTLLVGWDSKAIIFSRLVAFDYRNLIKF